MRRSTIVEFAPEKRLTDIGALDGYRSINAPMESCFGTLKTELVHQTNYPTREAAKRDLFAYIEGYYNRQRLPSVPMMMRQRPAGSLPLRA